jgi:hypothetical protein
VSDIFNTSTALGKLSLLGLAMVIIVFVMTAWTREWFVAGIQHRREITRGDKLEATNDKLTESLDRLTEIMESGKRGR